MTDDPELKYYPYCLESPELDEAEAVTSQMERERWPYEQILHYAFHHSNEDWFPKKYTYGEWLRDIYEVMVERGYWTGEPPPTPPQENNDE